MSLAKETLMSFREDPEGCEPELLAALASYEVSQPEQADEPSGFTCPAEELPVYPAEAEVSEAS